MKLFQIVVLALMALVVGACASQSAAPTATAIPATMSTSAPTAMPPLSPTTTPRKSGTLRLFNLVNVDVRHIPLLLAVDQLKAQGYTVEITALANSTLIVDALARGEADIGLLNNQTMWTAITKGANARTIAQFTGSTTVFAAKQEIKGCRELDGAPVGVASTSGLSPALFDMYLKDKCAGAKPQTLVIPESAGRSAGLLSGKLSAAVMPGEELLKLDQSAPGKFQVLMSYSQMFSQIQIDGLHARSEWAMRNPELVKDFARALVTAQRRLKETPQLLYDESVKRLSLDLATAKAIGDGHLQRGVWDPNGGLTKENIQYTIDFLVSIKALPAGTKVDDVSDLSYLNAVLNEIGRK